MSIAVSARIVRSRALAALCSGMAGVLLLTASVLLSRALLVPAAVCAIAAAGLALFPLSTAKACRVDVTDIGQILLTDTASEVVADRTGIATTTTEVVQLLGDSTFWSSLMVLRLQSASGRIRSLVLLPDSMDRAAFRALSVACRWIASRSASAVR